MLSKKDIDKLLGKNIKCDNPNYERLIGFLTMCGITFDDDTNVSEIDFLKLCKEVDVTKTRLLNESDIKDYPSDIQFLTQELYQEILERVIKQLSNGEEPNIDKIHDELGITHLMSAIKFN